MKERGRCCATPKAIRSASTDSARREQPTADSPRRALAAPPHDPVVVPRKDRARERAGSVHPVPRRPDLPLPLRGGPELALVDAPRPGAGQHAAWRPTSRIGGSTVSIANSNSSVYGSALRQKECQRAP